MLYTHRFRREGLRVIVKLMFYSLPVVRVVGVSLGPVTGPLCFPPTGAHAKADIGRDLSSVFLRSFECYALKTADGRHARRSLEASV